MMADILSAFGGASPAVQQFGGALRGMQEKKMNETQFNLDALQLKKAREEHSRGQVILPAKDTINTMIEGGIDSPQGKWAYEMLSNSGSISPEGGIKQEALDRFSQDVMTNPFLKTKFLSEKARGSELKYKRFEAAAKEQDGTLKKELMKKLGLKGDDDFAAAHEVVKRAYMLDYNNDQTVKEGLKTAQAESKKAELEYERLKSGFPHKEKLELARAKTGKPIYKKVGGDLYKIQGGKSVLVQKRSDEQRAYDNATKDPEWQFLVDDEPGQAELIEKHLRFIKRAPKKTTKKNYGVSKHPEGTTATNDQGVKIITKKGKWVAQ